jgi:hypothetical protein
MTQQKPFNVKTRGVPTGQADADTVISTSPGGPILCSLPATQRMLSPSRSGTRHVGRSLFGTKSCHEAMDASYNRSVAYVRKSQWYPCERPSPSAAVPATTQEETRSWSTLLGDHAV